MACCQEGGSCKHEGHAGHGAHRAHVDLSRAASHPAPGGEAVELSGSDQEAFRSALDAYLAIAARLAGDSVTGVAEQASALETAAARLAEASALDGHAGHLATVRQQAAYLARAATLPDAREAFGELSPAFAHLVAAAGSPEGMEVTRYVCGMADAPEGGVWLQAEGEPRNPYFGAAMLRCHRDQQAL
jgi:membrane fusion protein, copper/silver efflux system